MAVFFVAVAALAFEVVVFLVCVAFFAAAGLAAGFALVGFALEVEALAAADLVEPLVGGFEAVAFLGATAVLGLAGSFGWGVGLFY